MINVKKSFVLAFLVSLILGCSFHDRSHAPNICMESKPDVIPGMTVTGDRSSENVTHNLWPIVCQSWKLYEQQRKNNPDLKGVVKINMIVDFNGEIGTFAIARSTVNNPSFENKIKRLFQCMDFDPFGEHNSESEIMLPMHFIP